VGIAVFALNSSVGGVVGAMSFVLIIVMDTVFSIMITYTFLLPILEVLVEGKGVAQQSTGYKKMQQTKWMTMCGTTLSVMTSTLLYVNFFFFFSSKNDSWLNSNPWLNVFVFGINFDSICNDVGMIFICGVLKGASLSNPVSLTSARVAVVPQPSFIPNSQASSVYGPEEL
jgi:hypothetical protein